MYELLISSKATGKIWDVTNICPGAIEYDTERQGQPGTFTFAVILSGDLAFEEGDIVRFSDSGQLVFYGYVFKRAIDRWGVCTVTCYDRLRYLKTSASYSFYGLTAGDIIKQIAEDLLIDTGEIEDTGYAIPSLIETNQDCIDIINEAINLTLLNTGVLYTLYDNGSGLSLKSSKNWLSDTVLGTGSYLTDYTYSTDIDTNVYNSVKLVMANEDTGRFDAYVAEDSANIAKWGKLPLYQEVYGDLNAAQIAEQAKTTLAYYNKVRRTLPISAIGVPGVRAGMMIRVMIDDLDGANFAAWVLIESCSHSWQEGEHVMRIDVKELTDDLVRNDPESDL